MENPLAPARYFDFPISSGELETNDAMRWLHIPAIHIPYNQPLEGYASIPAVVYFTPGIWQGSLTVTTDAWPTRVDSSGTHAMMLPWGSAPADCHTYQGSIGTFSPNRQKVYCFSYGKPSRFAFSNNEGDTWTEKNSVPVRTSVFSGFPYSSAKIYAGRDPVRDPSTPGNPPDLNDTALIYVSWDRGETWHDVTGDLWDQTQALGIRLHPISGDPLGTKGLVTIAPRYQ